MRLVALDYGVARIGMAFCAHKQGAIVPVATFALANYPNRKSQLDAVAEAIRIHKADRLILGMPKSLSGQASITEAQCVNLAKRLRHRLNLPIHFENVALTTCQAHWDLEALGLPKCKHKAMVDQVAACRILQSFVQNLASLGEPYLTQTAFSQTL